MLIKKKTLTQVFFCEYCEIFQSTYSEEHLQTAASVSVGVSCRYHLAKVFL